MMFQGNLALKEIAQTQTQRGVERQGQFEDAYQLGIRELALAREGEFKDIQAVQRACHALINSAQFNRKDPRPLIYLAYTVLIFEKFEEASEYLKEALRLEPQNADAQFMLSFALRLKNNQKTSASQTLLSHPKLPTAGKNPEQLYDDLEKYIYAKLKSLLETDQRLEPSYEALEIQAYQANLLELESTLDAIQVQFRLLEKEYQIEALAQKIKPLEVLYRRYKQVIQHSQHLQQIETALQTLKIRLSELETDVKANPGQIQSFESHLDAYLDQMDTLADQLDDLEQQKISIAQLEPTYEYLVAQVAKIQDLLDQW